MVLEIEVDSRPKFESKLTKIIDSNVERDKTINKLFSQISENHLQTQLIIKENHCIVKDKLTYLSIQIEELKEQNKTLKEQLKIVSQELPNRKESKRLMVKKNQRRLPKREPITIKIYDLLIRSSQKFKYSNLYQSTRLRLAFVLLLITGIQISTLLQLKMKQVETLFFNNWIAIPRFEEEATNYKAFLTKEGSRIMQERRSDFERLGLLKDINSYIFTAQNSKKPLSREAFTNLINKFMKECTRNMDDNPNLSSHSFRIGFIAQQFWKDPNDIKFVWQALGHKQIAVTSEYVENFSEKQKLNRRLNNINVDTVESEVTI